MLALKRLLSLPLLLAAAVLPSSAATGVLQLNVRDSQTRYAIRATIHFTGPKSFSAQTDATGALQITLPVGEYQMETSANGYHTLPGHTVVQPATLPLYIMLESIAPPPEDRSWNSSIRPGFTVLHGYATDDRGQPVAGVHLHLQHSDGKAVTNTRGYFQFSVRTPPEFERDVPGIDTLIAEKPGYKTIIHCNILLPGDDEGLLLDLEKGAGTINFDDTHVLMRNSAPPCSWNTTTATSP